MTGFYYPLFQTGLMFVGEALCVFATLGCRKKKPKDLSLDFPGISYFASTGDQTLIKKSYLERCGRWGFCISALFDFLGSSLEYYSFDLLRASAIVTFKMMVIIFIWAYRVFILKKVVYRHQWLGLGLLFLGFIIVGFEVTLRSHSNIDWDGDAGMGIAIMLIAQIFNSLNIISEEYLMNKIPIKVEHVVTIEGVTGLFLCGILYLPFRYFVSITNGNAIELVEPFEKIYKDTDICILVIAMLGVIGMLNFFLVKTIKIADSLALCTIDSGRVILVWVLAIAFNFESVLPVEITGGFSLILGILIYNEVIILPCCGFKKSAKLSMKESEMYKELKIQDRSWQTKLDSILFK